MSAKGLQLFASGLFFATAVMGGAYLYSSNSPKESAGSSAPTVQDMKQALVEEGFIVTTAEEMEQQVEQANTEMETKTIYKLVLNIQPGMSSYDVAEILHRSHIISKEQDFLDYIETNQLAKSLRVGEYELSSEQTMEEIVSAITK